MKTPFFERLAAMYREAGKEEKKITFLCMWVTRFGKFIEPGRYYEATGTEVEAFVPEPIHRRVGRGPARLLQ